MDGWMEVKAILRIAYSNQNIVLKLFNIRSGLFRLILNTGLKNKGKFFVITKHKDILLVLGRKIVVTFVPGLIYSELFLFFSPFNKKKVSLKMTSPVLVYTNTKCLQCGNLSKIIYSA